MGVSVLLRGRINYLIKYPCSPRAPYLQLCVCCSSSSPVSALGTFGERFLHPGTARANAQPQPHNTHPNRGTARGGIERFNTHSLCGNSSRKLWGEAECWQLPSEALRMRLLILQQRNLLCTPCSAALLFIPPLAGPCPAAGSANPSNQEFSV